MCILFIAVQQHKDFPLIIAANRDEFHPRPTQPSQYWASHPHIVAGKDLKAGGTWMGVETGGRISALTNIREPDRQDPNARTRGELVLNYLDYRDEAHHASLNEHYDKYNGFNLLYGSADNLWVFNNRTQQNTQLKKGVHGLSNAQLNSPWPKLTAGMNKLAQYSQHDGPINDDDLFALLANETKADDEVLPQTGVPYQWEKKLSSIFIKSEEYGTRSSTILKVDNSGKFYWHEIGFDNQANVVSEFKTEFRPNQQA